MHLSNILLFEFQMYDEEVREQMRLSTNYRSKHLIQIFYSVKSQAFSYELREDSHVENECCRPGVYVQ